MAAKKRPTAAQHEAFDAALKRDGAALLKDVAGAAFEHLRDHPESVITRTLTEIEQGTGAFTMMGRILRRYANVTPPEPAKK